MVHVRTQDPMDARAGVEIPTAVDEMQRIVDDKRHEATVDRFPFHRTDGSVTVFPALADRPVVVRPETPLHLLSSEAARLYVSTPLWVGIDVGEDARKLHEIPSYRPSDTWFGPSTREGELCYATRTNGRLNLEMLPRRLHRAITPLHVRNRSSEAMLLERLQLPVQYLSLYQGENSYLWTQAVTVQQLEAPDHATVRLGKGAPKEASGGELIREPRLKTRDNLIMRTFGAFSSLFT